MADKRTEAARARAIALLVIEKHRLQEAILDEEETLELSRHLGVPSFQLAASERRIALLRDELGELTPTRRATTDEPRKETADG